VDKLKKMEQFIRRNW